MQHPSPASVKSHTTSANDGETFEANEREVQWLSEGMSDLEVKAIMQQREELRSKGLLTVFKTAEELAVQKASLLQQAKEDAPHESLLPDCVEQLELEQFEFELCTASPSIVALLDLLVSYAA